MGKTIMIVGAGPFQLPAIYKAQEMGYRVVANDANPDAVGLKVADFPYPVDLKDVEECIRIARKHQISGVLTVAAEVAVPTVAAIAEALGLPGLSPEAALAATDKSVMRERLQENGVPSPKFRKGRSIKEIKEHVREIGLPVVVKPADNAGSRGVSLVETMSGLPDAFSWAYSQSPRGLVLVEEFMPGVEISVEAFVYRGKVHILSLSDKIRTPPPNLLDTTVLFPSEHPESIQERAREIARLAIRAVGIDMATVHMEQMVTPDGPKVVELAARGAGFRVFTDMLPWVTGIDVVGELIKIAVGMEPELTVKHQRGCVLRFPEVGIGQVKSLTGIDEARKIPGIFDFNIYIKPGDIIRPLRSGSDRIGHIIAMAETRRQALEIVHLAEKTFHVEFAT